MTHLERGDQMIGGTAKAPPSLAALSEAQQLLEMLGNEKTLRRRLEELKAHAALCRAAEGDADAAVAAAKLAKAESAQVLEEIAAAKAALEKAKQAHSARADALHTREQELNAREGELKPKWEALRREALALQGRASKMAASAVAFAKDLES